MQHPRARHGMAARLGPSRRRPQRKAAQRRGQGQSRQLNRRLDHARAPGRSGPSRAALEADAPGQPADPVLPAPALGKLRRSLHPELESRNQSPANTKLAPMGSRPG